MYKVLCCMLDWTACLLRFSHTFQFFLFQRCFYYVAWNILKSHGACLDATVIVTCWFRGLSLWFDVSHKMGVFFAGVSGVMRGIMRVMGLKRLGTCTALPCFATLCWVGAQKPFQISGWQTMSNLLRFGHAVWGPKQFALDVPLDWLKRCLRHQHSHWTWVLNLS